MNSSCAYCSAPAARAASIAPCACCISLSGGSAHAALATAARTARDTSARRRRRIRQVYRCRARGSAGKPGRTARRRCKMMNLLPDDRPREKLRSHGVAALGDNELVALVIGHGSRGGDALAVANALLAAHGGLHGLTRCTVDDCRRTPGIGTTRAAQIVAAVELGRRTLARPASARPQIRTAGDAAAYLMPRYCGREIEQFGIVLLDTKYRVLRTAILASGTLNSTIVQPREVYRAATSGGAAAIVVFHNHPSGDPTPSPEDVDLTRRLAAAGLLLGIDLVDHLILGERRYWSFKESDGQN